MAPKKKKLEKNRHQKTDTSIAPGISSTYALAEKSNNSLVKTFALHAAAMALGGSAGEHFTEHAYVAVTGYALATTGMAIAGYQHRKFRRNFERKIYWEGLPEKVVTEGLNGIVRHPMYSAYGLAATGCVAINPSLLSLVTGSMLLTKIVLTAVMEEKALGQRFGNEYESYKRNIPMFIPKLETIADTANRFLIRNSVGKAIYQATCLFR